MALAKGTELGSYRIGALLGAGGMGQVYRATDTRLGRDVAIKILPPEVAENPDRRARFVREARVLAGLAHPNVLAIYDVGDGYIVSELIEGESLLHASLSQRRAIDVVAQAAEGLAAAHAMGITHRDVKPENILVTHEGRAKLLDFGIAKHDASDQHQGETSTLTEPGSVIGTIAYMSPGQVRGQHLDHRTDIFSLGLVLYELLASRRPFNRVSSAETMAAIANEDAPELSGDVPKGLRQVVARCLEKDPANRFQSAKDLAFALRVLSGGETTSAIAVAPRQRNFLFISTVLLALTLAYAMWWRVAKPGNEPEPIRLLLPPPAGTSFTESGAVISPDGRMIAFVATAPGKQSLWVRQLREVEAQELPGTSGAAYPFWSSDSKSIAFFATGKLRRVGTSGGIPEDICDVSSGRGGSWSRHDVVVFADAGTGLRRVPAGGGKPVPLTELSMKPREFEHRWPRFFPDGERFLFWALTGDANTTGVYVASLSAPQNRSRVVTTNFRADYALAEDDRDIWLFWVRGSTLVVQPFNLEQSRTEHEPQTISEVIGTGALGFAHFSVSSAGVLVYGLGSVGKKQMELRNRKGELIRVVGIPGDFYYPSFSPDGNQAAVTRVESGNSDLWLYEFGRDVSRRLTFDRGADNFPVWSPDGRQIAFSGSRGGSRNILIKDLAQLSTERRVAQSPNPQYACDWSADGRYLIYREVHPATGSDLWLLSLGPNEPKPEPFLVTQFEESDGAFAPDGKWIAYTSNESGRAEVYVQPFPATGDKWVVSDLGGGLPRWRGDGRELFYVASDARLMSVEVNSAEGRIVFASPRELFRTTIRLGVPWYDYDAAADGSRFLLLHPATEVARRCPWSCC